MNPGSKPCDGGHIERVGGGGVGAFQETIILIAHAKVLRLGWNVLGVSFGSRKGREVRDVGRVHQVGLP